MTMAQYVAGHDISASAVAANPDRILGNPIRGRGSWTGLCTQRQSSPIGRPPLAGHAMKSQRRLRAWRVHLAIRRLG